MPANNSIPDWLIVVVQSVSIVGGVIGILTVLISRVFPWLRAKYRSMSLAGHLSSPYTKVQLERAMRYYISQHCQDVDPAGSEEPRLSFAVRQELFKVLDRAFAHPTDFRYIILLADSGMGKTTALINYYARHLRRWRKPYRIVLIPLGKSDADQRIESVADKESTVLFLDALDEDIQANVDHVERLRFILKKTETFLRVVITCRSQFFSRDEEIPRRTGIIRIDARSAGDPAEYLFHKLYLSPFSDADVRRYIRKRYAIWHLPTRRLCWKIIARIPDLIVRPMLLSHLEDVVRSGRTVKNSYDLYHEMVEAWLRREQGFIPNTEDLREFSERLAVDMFVNRALRRGEEMTKRELAQLASDWRIPLDDWELTGRSLLNRDVEGNYKLAHRSIMEYLFVKRFLEGNIFHAGVPWTDAMRKFAWDAIEVSLTSESRHENLVDMLARFRASSEVGALLPPHLETRLGKLDTDFKFGVLLALLLARPASLHETFIYRLEAREHKEGVEFFRNSNGVRLWFAETVSEIPLATLLGGNRRIFDLPISTEKVVNWATWVVSQYTDSWYCVVKSRAAWIIIFASTGGKQPPSLLRYLDKLVDCETGWNSSGL